MNTGLTPLLSFFAIIAMIPVALWLLKRTPIGGGATQGVMRTVAALPLSTNQRLLIVEVGSGDDRQWLVLGATAQQITVLHTMAPQVEPVQPAAMHALIDAPFAQLMDKLRNKGTRDAQ